MEGTHRCIMFGLASGVTKSVPTKLLLNRIVMLFVTTKNPLISRNFLYFQCETEKNILEPFRFLDYFSKRHLTESSGIRPISLF